MRQKMEVRQIDKIHRNDEPRQAFRRTRAQGEQRSKEGQMAVHYAPSRSRACPISHIIRRRRYAMFVCVNAKFSSPRDSDSRNWHVKTPQS